MNKYFKNWVILILFPCSVFAQENKIQLTEKVSIEFPDKPNKRDVQGMATVYTIKLADSTANFNVVVTNLEKSNGLSADVLSTAQSEPGFWEQTESSFISSLGTDVNPNILSKEIIEINNQKILKLLIGTNRNGKYAELTAYIFVNDVFSIKILYTKRSENASTESKNKFLNSLKINE